ncbi:hypothetical protein [Sedimenticola hydrogenitrophicus]|uniref:hypothetical protein n=1 Tax=Sedimenticola hydrogenitrophicus TaxID=2967975 RepID=UPI0023AF9CAC|nr:hypothetical protein [Sedimenticola hydrogenitrophicus]
MSFHDTPLSEIEQHIAEALGVDEVCIAALEFAAPNAIAELSDNKKIRVTLRIVVAEVDGADR